VDVSQALLTKAQIKRGWTVEEEDHVLRVRRAGRLALTFSVQGANPEIVQACISAYEQGHQHGYDDGYEDAIDEAAGEKRPGYGTA
jgi:flagellar biosynthesis/type III secretory pathway protein FliH